MRTSRLALAMLPLGGILAYQFLPSSTQSTGRALGNPALVVATHALDVGSVWAQTDYECILPIRNVTGREIRIVRFQTSCECSSILPESLTLRPGEESSVTVRIKSSPSDSVSVSEHEFDVTIQPLLSDPTRIVPPWTIRGAATRALDLSPPETRFLEIGRFVQGRPSAPVVVDLTPRGPIIDLQATCDSRFGIVEVQRIDGVGRPFQLALSMNPDLAAGVHSFDIPIHAALAGSASTSFKLPVTVRITPEISASPSFLVLGTGLLGDTLEDPVVLHSASELPFHVTSFTTDAANISVHPLDNPQVPNAFRISASVQSLGLQRSDVVFTSRASRREERRTVLPISFYGRSPAASSVVSSVDGDD